MSDELEIGKVLGVHGVKGALRVRLYSMDSTALEAGRVLRLARGQETLLRGEIERASAKPGTDQVRVWFKEVSCRNQAEGLKGAQLWIDKNQLGDLPDDEFYLADLVGLTLRMRQAPDHSLGRIVGVIDNRLQDLLEIEWQGPQGSPTRWLLPAVGPYLEEITEDTLWIDPPDGLLPAALERLVRGEDAGAASESESQ